MIAEWESNVSSARLISFLSCPIDLIAPTFSGREFHSKAPLKPKRIMCTLNGLGRHIGWYIGRYIGRLSTDYRSTIGRQSVDYRSIVDRYIGRQSTDKCVDRYSLKPSILDRYMTDTWPIHDRYLTDTWPILDRFTTDTWPIHDRYMTDTWPILDRYLTDTWPILDRHLTDTSLILGR